LQGGVMVAQCAAADLDYCCLHLVFPVTFKSGFRADAVPCKGWMGLHSFLVSQPTLVSTLCTGYL
jgi:hypothetical protein